MNFKPSWKFWVNVLATIMNLTLFVQTGDKLCFWLSAVCCFFSLMVFKAEKAMFAINQRINAAFDKQKEKDDDDI